MGWPFSTSAAPVEAIAQNTQTVPTTPVEPRRVPDRNGQINVGIGEDGNFKMMIFDERGVGSLYTLSRASAAFLATSLTAVLAIRIVSEAPAVEQKTIGSVTMMSAAADCEACIRAIEDPMGIYFCAEHECARHGRAWGEPKSAPCNRPKGHAPPCGRDDRYSRLPSVDSKP